VEVPCPYAGTVAALHGAVGDVIAVGQPLLTIAPPADPASRADEDHREEERAGSGAVLVGYGTDHGRRQARRRRRARHGTARTARPDRTPAAPKVISPVVRRLAREHGLDLTTLSGTGPAGVILRRDVDAALREAEAATQAPAPDVRRVERDLRDRRIPMRGVRRT
ncbi:MAG: 2-oxo acid dehydrogenase subunit E2, partial [Actinobacteria bacterium]|nr:2-oxo acid dehydrogenase subunit E2 [Actinomycetota bacterium]